MPKVLVTGMSGTGESAAAIEIDVTAPLSQVVWQLESLA
jgi:hypothetical protein